MERVSENSTYAVQIKQLTETLDKERRDRAEAAKDLFRTKLRFQKFEEQAMQEMNEVHSLHHQRRTHHH
jgi:hypothetical protein